MNRITLQDFQAWYYRRADPETARIIEEQIRDQNSEAYHLLWMSAPDLSNPPPSIPRLPDDQVPQDFERWPVLEELRQRIAAESAAGPLSTVLRSSPWGLERPDKRARSERIPTWLRRPSTVATAALGVVIGLLVLLAQSWPGKANASLVEKVNLSYSEVNRVNLETALSTAAGMTQEDRSAVVAQLIPDSDRLLAVFNQGAALREGDSVTRAAKAKALIGRARLGHALGSKGDDEAALADLDRAKAIYDTLPPTVDRDVALADVSLSRTAILGPQQRYDEALAVLAPVISALQAVVQDQPARADARFRLARLLNNRANCRGGLAAHVYKIDNERKAALRDDAEADYEQAIGLLRSLVQDGAADENVVEWLSRVQGNIGLLLLSQVQGRGPEAAAEAEIYFERAVEVAEDLARRFPESLTAQDALVAAVINLGDGRRARKHLDKAEASYRRTVGLYDNLHAKYPVLREFVWGQALARKSLGITLLEHGKKDEAGAVLADALARYDWLVARYPGVADIIAERDDLVRTLGEAK